MQRWVDLMARHAGCGVLKRYVFDDYFSGFSVELVNLFAS